MFLVRGHIPALGSGWARRTVGFLLGVFNLYLRKIQGDAFRCPVVPLRTSVIHTGDQNLLQADLEVFNRMLTGLAARERGLLEMLAIAARLKQVGSGLVDVMREVQ